MSKIYPTEADIKRAKDASPSLGLNPDLAAKSLEKYFVLINPTKEQYNSLKQLLNDCFFEKGFLGRNKSLDKPKMLIFAAKSYINFLDNVRVVEIEEHPVNPFCYYHFISFDEFISEVNKRYSLNQSQEFERSIESTSNSQLLEENRYKG